MYCHSIDIEENTGEKHMEAIKLNIEIQTYDYNLNKELYELINKEKKINLGEDTTLEYCEDFHICCLGDSSVLIEPETISFFLEITKDIGICIFSAWLYEKLKNQYVLIKVNFPGVYHEYKAESEIEIKQVLQYIYKKFEQIPKNMKQLTELMTINIEIKNTTNNIENKKSPQKYHGKSSHRKNRK
jgi:hypothetical protein